MGRRRDARRRQREVRRSNRAWTIRVVVLVAAVVVAGLTDDWWARRFDDLVGVLGDGSTAAALAGWLAGFSVVIYGLGVLASRRRWPDALRRTWPLGVLLLIPAMTLQPSRTRRSGTIQDEYWYLGSFFDTYGAALLTVVAAGGVALLGLWLSTRGDTANTERSDRWWKITAHAATAVLAAGTLGTLIWAIVGF